MEPKIIQKSFKNRTKKTFKQKQKKNDILTSAATLRTLKIELSPIRNAHFLKITLRSPHEFRLENVTQKRSKIYSK